MSEEEIEIMIEECLSAIEDDIDNFTEFEITFLESIEDLNETRHLTDGQIEKLKEIYEEKVQEW